MGSLGMKLTSVPVFRQANKLEKAMISHEKALDWQELFELAVQQGSSDEDLKSLAYRIAGTRARRFFVCIL